MGRKTMLMIVNPTAGRQEMRDYFLEAVDRFIKAGFDVSVHTTQKQRDAYEIARNRGGEFEYLVCSGGDGTLSETINGMMELEERPVLGYIPCGTTNDFAASLGLSSNLPSAVDTVLEDHCRFIDVGSFDRHYFTYIAAFGLFTDVSYATPQDMKNMLGHLAYLLEGVKRLGAIRPYRCTAEHEGGVLEGEFIYGMVTNSMSIGGFKGITGKDILLDDGLLEAILIRMPQSLLESQGIVAALLSGDLDSEQIFSSKIKRLSIRSDTNIPWTLDGEYGGKTRDVNILCHPNAIRILTDGPV